MEYTMIKQFVINQDTFNVAMADAFKQRKAMTILSRYVMAHSLALGDRKIDTAFIKGVLLALPEDEISQLHDLLMSQVMCEQQAVDLKFFQGKMMSYFELLAESVVYNLSDFFIWLDDERKSPVSPKKKAK